METGRDACLFLRLGGRDEKEEPYVIMDDFRITD